MKAIGTASFHDLPGYLKWYSQVDADQFEALSFFSRHNDRAYEKTEIGKVLEKCKDEWFSVWRHFRSISPDSYKARFRVTIEKNYDRLERFCRYAEEFGQIFSVGVWETDGAFLYLGNGSSGIFVPDPAKYLTFTPAKDFTNTTIAEMRALYGVTKESSGRSIVPAEAEQSMTQASIQESVKNCEDVLSALRAERDRVDRSEIPELKELEKKIEAMKQELYEKKEAMMAELNKKKEEMEQQKSRLEKQIYLLDSQIYAILCYTGEVIRFAHIKTGKPAAKTEPLVIYQKLRFLDEDLGRLASLYEIQWEDLSLFEEFLRYHPAALDTFAPNEKCVMLVRLSKTGKQIGADHQMPFSNLLTYYEYYHGKTIGIIIRNGENIYLGWTDETRIHIDDDLLIGNIVTEVAPAEDSPYGRLSEEAENKKREEEAARIVDGLISRSFIYNILQGVVDHSPILDLPSGTKLNQQSEYVIYSMADRWLTDNRYGSFGELMNRCNELVKEGDMVLTMQHLIPGGYVPFSSRYYGSGRWENPRGRGEKNRTHDCSVSDCTIYPINLVEFEEPVEMVRYTEKISTLPDFGDPDPSLTDTLECFKRRIEGMEEVEPGVYNKEERTIQKKEQYTIQTRHIYVSVKKTDVWNSRSMGIREARANFELYDSEFINLTYMNSVWLEWCINNNKLGNWSIAGTKVDYAYGIRYLKTALDYIRKREAEEKQLLSAVDESICQNSEWPVLLSEWKLANKVRVITPYQAKRFAKQYHTKG